MLEIGINPDVVLFLGFGSCMDRRTACCCSESGYVNILGAIHQALLSAKIHQV